jgi:hypothetical protein
MKKEIDDVIKEAIEQDWFNEMTTSDLQGVCEAKAFNIIKKHNPFFSLNQENAYIPVMEISSQIIEGIYDAANA